MRAEHYHKCDELAVGSRTSLDAVDTAVNLVAIVVIFVAMALQPYLDSLLAFSARSSQIHSSPYFGNPLFCMDCMHALLAIEGIFLRISCAAMIETVPAWHCWKSS